VNPQPEIQVHEERSLILFFSQNCPFQPADKPKSVQTNITRVAWYKSATTAENPLFLGRFSPLATRPPKPDPGYS
jgi:hypothetical protein